jgi:hypothetical protein
MIAELVVFILIMLLLSNILFVLPVSLGATQISVILVIVVFFGFIILMTHALKWD